MARIDRAKESGAETVEIWGSGQPRREFLFCDDLADALVFLMRHYSDESHVNVGTGTDVTIREAAELLAEIIGFKGRFVFDATKPDGTSRKLLDVDLLSGLGWRAKTSLREGLEQTYRGFLDSPRGRRGG